MCARCMKHAVRSGRALDLSFLRPTATNSAALKAASRGKRGASNERRHARRSAHRRPARTELSTSGPEWAVTRCWRGEAWREAPGVGSRRRTAAQRRYESDASQCARSARGTDRPNVTSARRPLRLPRRGAEPAARSLPEQGRRAERRGPAAESQRSAGSRCGLTATRGAPPGRQHGQGACCRRRRAHVGCWALGACARFKHCPL